MFDSCLLSFPPYSTPSEFSMDTYTHLYWNIQNVTLLHHEWKLIFVLVKKNNIRKTPKIRYTNIAPLHSSIFIYKNIYKYQPKTIIHQHEYKHTFTQTHIFTRNARSLPGFCRLRMHSKGTQHGSVPVAFVEFKDAACAGSAMSALQGTFLLSSDRGAIRIEYAKSKMVADAAAAIAQLERSMCFNSIPFTQTFHIFFYPTKKTFHSLFSFLLFFCFVSEFLLHT